MANFQPDESHWYGSYYRQRILKRDLQDWLLNGHDVSFRNGVPCVWKHKHLGAGVYELWLEERNG